MHQNKVFQGFIVLCILCVYAPFGHAVQICETPNLAGEWDINDGGEVTIPMSFDVGDVATTAYEANSVYVDITHEYAGDLGGRLISPDATNIHLWQLGDGTVPPSTTSFGECGDLKYFGGTYPGGGYKFTVTDASANPALIDLTESTYCTGTNVDVVTGGTGGVGSPYTFTRSNPTDAGIQGTAQPIAPLSSFVGDEVIGDWGVFIKDSFALDVGTVNEVCVDLGFGGLDVAFYISSNATCSDELESGSFGEGSTIYVCSSVVNKGTETFEVQSGDYSNDYGVDISSFETSYTTRDTVGSSQTVISSFTTGSGSSYPVGSYTLNTGVTVTGTDTNFTSSDTLSTNQSVSFSITDETNPVFSRVDVSSNNSNPLYAMAGDLVSFTISLVDPDTWSATNNLDFTIGTGSTITTSNFTANSSPTGTGTVTYTVQSGNNGQISFVGATFTDGNGNTLTGVTLPYTPSPNLIIDTISPVLNFNEDVDVGPLQSDTVNITVSDDNIDSTTFEYGFSPDATCDASDTFGNSFTGSTNIEFTTEFNNGNYICSRALDLAGNTGYQISTHPLNIDITDPIAPIITSPLDTAAINDSTPTISGTGEAKGVIEVIVDSQTYTGAIDNFGNWSIDVTHTLSDGSYSVNSKQIDEAGNTGPSTAIILNIDTQAPILREITSIPTPDNDSTPGYTFSSDEAGALSYGGSCTSITSTGAIGNISLTFESLADGLYTDCTLTVTDSAGNASQALDVSDFRIDTMIPVITLNGSGSIDIEFGNSYSDFGATASDNIDGNITGNIITNNPVDPNTIASYIVSYDVNDNAGNHATQVNRTVNVIDTTAPVFTVNDDIVVGPVQGDILNVSVVDLDLDVSTFEYGFSADASCDGSDTFGNSFSSGTNIIFNSEINNGNYICLRAGDLTGNVSYQISTNPINIDITPPPDPIFIADMTSSTDSGLSDNDDTTSNQTPDFTGSCIDGDIVTLYIGGNANDSTVCSGSIYTLTPTSALLDAEYDITVNFQDVAGNISGYSPVVSIIIDTGNPDPVSGVSLTSPTDTGGSDSDDITSNQTPSIEGTGEAGAIVSFVVDSTTLSGAIDSSGDWSIDTVSSLADGDYTASISQVDDAGNMSLTSQFGFTVDTINNTPSITTPIEGDGIINLEEGTSVLVEGTAEPDSSLNITFDDGIHTPIVGVVPVDNLGEWTLLGSEADISSLDEGTISISVVSIDVAGNMSTLSSVSVQYDPSIPTKSDPVTFILTDTNAIIIWETDELSSSEVLYGLTSGVSETSGEGNISPNTTSHNIILSDLLSCTVYTYQTVSRDIAGNEFISTADQFQTPGCPGDADIISESTSDIILSTQGGNVSTSDVGLTIPIGYDTGGVCSIGGAYFQTKKLETAPVVVALGTPVVSPVFNAVGAYELSSYCDSSQKIESFSEPLTVRLTYDESEVGVFDESSLSTYRYNADISEWEELTSCVTDIILNTITCETTSFSTFAIFGKARTDSSSRSRGGGGGGGSISISKNIVKTPTVTIKMQDTSMQSSTSGDVLNHEMKSQGTKNTDSIMSKPLIEKIYTDVSGVQQEYVVLDDFASCPVIGDLKNKAYEYPKSGAFLDISGVQFENEILKFAEIGIVDGFENGEFRPGQEITRAEFLKVILISHCYDYTDMDPSDLSYGDVDKSSWQARVIAKAQELGMINGDIDEAGQAVFRPNDIISKAEATKIAMRISNIQALNPVVLGYEDVSTGWHISYVETGETLGIFNSQDDNFSFLPEEGVTRQEMLNFIYKLVQLY